MKLDGFSPTLSQIFSTHLWLAPWSFMETFINLVPTPCRENGHVELRPSTKNSRVAAALAWYSTGFGPSARNRKTKAECSVWPPQTRKILQKTKETNGSK